MNSIQRKLRLNPIIIVALCSLLLTNLLQANYRIRGSVSLQGYGYEDYNEENHLWLMPSTNFSVYHLGKPVSLHFSGGYIGDNQDDYSTSGQARFLRGYVQYGKLSDAYRIRVGRFFMTRGVALGTIDGLEFENQFGSNLKYAVFGGITGPRNRGFEYANSSDATSLGGEVKWMARKLSIFTNPIAALSYTSQIRDGYEYRNKLGLSFTGRIKSNLTVSGLTHLGLSGNLFQRAVLRIRHHCETWNTMAEVGTYQYGVSDDSWFTEMDGLNFTSVRLVTNRQVFSKGYAAGIETSLTLTEKSGYRLGPVITIPYGQVGYRFTTGDLSTSSGPWANIQYTPLAGLNTFVYAAMYTYEWDAFDLAEREIGVLSAGGNYTPQFRKDITLNAEYQAYRTPEFTSDRRFLMGATWNFDTGAHSK